MFGGLAFLVGGRMAVTVSRHGGVMVNVDPAATEALLRRQHTQPMVMRGRVVAGWIRVEPEGVRTRRQLAAWVRRGVDHVSTLPPK
jgi:hypothetical protein